MLGYELMARMKTLYGRPSVAAPAYTSAFHSGAATEGRPYRVPKEPPPSSEPQMISGLVASSGHGLYRHKYRR